MDTGRIRRAGLALAVLISLGGLGYQGGIIAQAASKSQMVAGVTTFHWTFPRKGTRNTWTFKGGVASYVGNGNSSLLAPYTVKGSSFAIQAQIQGGGPGDSTWLMPGFGLTAQGKTGSVQAGSFYSDYENEDNNPAILWNGDTIGGGALDPGSAWHLYRLEVRGAEYTLSIDGTVMVQYPLDRPPTVTRVGVFGTFYKVQVKNFQVQSLPAQTSLHSAMPATKQFALTLADLPSTTYYDRLLRHFYTNEEIARERGVPLSSVQAAGRVTSYGVDYFSYLWSGRLYDSVTAFTSPALALADAQSRLTILQQTYRPTATLQTPADLGDHSLGFTAVRTTSSGRTYNLVFLWVQRGSYTAYFTLQVPTSNSYSKDLPSLLLPLARIVDNRLPK